MTRSASRKTIGTWRAIAKGLVAVLGVVASSAACGPHYDRMDFTGTVAELGGEVSVRHLTVYEGMIVKSHIVAWNDDDEPMRLEIRSGQTNIVEVDGVVRTDDYAFIGRAVGRTSLHFIADDVEVLVVDADVLLQPALP